jgi:hypothetical protein
MSQLPGDKDCGVSVECAVPAGGHWVQYAVLTDDGTIKTYGDQNWVRSGGALGPLSGDTTGIATLERDVRIFYGPWRIAAGVGEPAPAKALPAARPQCDEDADDGTDCPGLVVWRWHPPDRPGEFVWLCDDHADDKPLSDLEDLADLGVSW